MPSIEENQTWKCPTTYPTEKQHIMKHPYQFHIYCALGIIGLYSSANPQK
jgi:hypothetical protein